jgi:hypothetical protein
MISRRLVVALLGLAAWICGALIAPSGLWRALLLAPLLIVPALLATSETRWPWMDTIAFGAALPLTLAVAMAPGVAPAVLAVPWLGLCGVLAIVAVRDGLRAMPGILAPDRASDLGQLVARGFLAVGAFFVLADRAGWTLGFNQQTVMLTAVHFHFAGFGLLTVTAILAFRTHALRLPVLGLIGGIPLTALGWTAGLPWIAATGATLTAASGFATGVALLLGLPSTGGEVSGLRRGLFSLAGLGLMIAMPFAIAWTVSLALGSTFLDIDRMAAVHGSLNALAVLIASFSVDRGEPASARRGSHVIADRALPVPRV